VSMYGSAIKASARLVAAVALALAPLRAARATCYHTIDTHRLSELMDRAEYEYAKWETGLFVELANEIESSIPCIDDKVLADVAARLHRIVGLRARIVERDDDRARMAFAASRALDPNYRFPEDMISPGDPEHELYLAIPLQLWVTEQVPMPAAGSIRFDGSTTLDRPRTFATLFQYVGHDGQVVETAYLWPGDDMPGYLTKDAVTAALIPRERTVPRFALGGASAVVTGAGLALTTSALWDRDHACVSEPTDPACEARSRERATAGVGLLVVGIAGFVGTAVALHADADGGGVHIHRRW